MPAFNADTAHIVFQQFLLERHTAPLEVTGGTAGDRLHLQFILPITAPCFLHWGLAHRPGGTWTRPPRDYYPDNSVVFDELAVQSPFTPRPELQISELLLDLPFPCLWRSVEFVLYFPQENKYVKNRRYDFSLVLPQSKTPQESPLSALNRWYPPAMVIDKNTPADVVMKMNELETRQTFTLDTGYDVALLNREISNGREIILVTNLAAPAVLHWGFIDRFHSCWKLPVENSRDKNTVVFDDRSVRTPLIARDDLLTLRLFFHSGDDAPENLAFLFYSPDEDLWHKHQNNDLTCSLFLRQLDTQLPDTATQIIAAEIGKNSWTLMHRYNLARELLLRANDDLSLWQIIFVWLRYSAIRQLDWQRNYNTKPRDLAGAQKSLTLTLADNWQKFPKFEQRVWTRNILQTVGRGGDGGQGQRIRDEILNIMHRHKMKEAHGHFIEEWHQKLHNNTTPDDLWICRAFIAFMRANGDLGVFYGTLEKAGISRERLRSFERPIVTDPQFYAHCKDGLISDLENYLQVLLAVHGGVELELCGDRAAWRLGDGGKQMYAKVKSGKASADELVALRREIIDRAYHANNGEEILDWVYFDSAVGDKFRTLYEQIKADDDLTVWFAAALVNADLLEKIPELEFCRAEWQRLQRAPVNHDTQLMKLASADRVTRVVQNETAKISAALQTPADYLGKSFGVAEWTRKIFVEEVIRGSDWFPLAKSLHLLTRKIRTDLELGGWQIISPAAVRGRLVIVENLHSVMDTIYHEPTILLTERAAGDEDAPEGAVGIVTRIAPDLVAHLSVRARNLGLLFAACFDDDDFAKLQNHQGRFLAMKTTPNGAVTYEVVDSLADANIAKKSTSPIKVKKPAEFSHWVIEAKNFNREILGGKSNNLNLLRGKLPEWMHLPSALALPFGVAEKVLNDPLNDNLYQELKTVLVNVEHKPLEYLPNARNLLLNLLPPPPLRTEFMEKLSASGLPNLTWDLAWQAIKKVWASKWNERAFLSRRQIEMPHSALQMAVLVQQVVNAAYAFVIHTVNPITGKRDEIFAEVVAGLGEVLVGNYPGHSLGFTLNKNGGEIRFVSFPSKSVGLYSPGDQAVIFRSDSNGEDLAGFAGAGLYDSVLAEEPILKNLNYAQDRLLTDKDFREELCRKIAEIGMAVEKIGGTAQDIEGAFDQRGNYYIVQNRPQVGATA